MAAFCTIDDVLAHTQSKPYSWETRPTDAQVQAFMEQRAAQIVAVMTNEVGTDSPGPPGFDTLVNATNDEGRALAALLIMVNAKGAAADALIAAGPEETASGTDRAVKRDKEEKLLREFKELMTSVRILVRRYIQISAPGGGEAVTHVSRGRNVTGLLFDLKTEW